MLNSYALQSKALKKFCESSYFIREAPNEAGGSLCSLENLVVATCWTHCGWNSSWSSAFHLTGWRGGARHFAFFCHLVHIKFPADTALEMLYLGFWDTKCKSEMYGNTEPGKWQVALVNAPGSMWEKLKDLFNLILGFSTGSLSLLLLVVCEPQFEKLCTNDYCWPGALVILPTLLTFN